jgi:hypothetical protein
MTPTGERLLGVLMALVIVIALIMAASPFINSMNGYGFRWIF